MHLNVNINQCTCVKLKATQVIPKCLTTIISFNQVDKI